MNYLQIDTLRKSTFKWATSFLLFVSLFFTGCNFSGNGKSLHFKEIEHPEIKKLCVNEIQNLKNPSEQQTNCVRSFSEIQQDPLYINATDLQKALAAVEYFEFYVARQENFKKASVKAQDAMRLDFMAKYNIPVLDGDQSKKQDEENKKNIILGTLTLITGVILITLLWKLSLWLFRLHSKRISSLNTPQKIFESTSITMILFIIGCAFSVKFSQLFYGDSLTATDEWDWHHFTYTWVYWIPCVILCCVILSQYWKNREL